MEHSELPVQRPEPVKAHRRSRSLSPSFFALYTVLALIIVLITVFAVYEIFIRDRVVLGVSVFGQSITGATKAETRKLLQDKFGNPDAILKRTGGQPVILRDGERSWRAWPWELGLRTDFGPVADSAILLGHRGSFLENLIEQARCALAGCDIGLEARFDVNIAQSYLSWLAPQVDQPAHDASVRVEGLRVIATPA